MSRMIDADALEKEGWSLHRTIQVDKNTSEYQTKPLRQVPTIEPERKKGRWIPCTKKGLPLSEMAYREGQKWYGYKCSNCNFIYKGNALTESPYCQKCGARMEGEK